MKPYVHRMAAAVTGGVLWLASGAGRAETPLTLADCLAEAELYHAMLRMF